MQITGDQRNIVQIKANISLQFSSSSRSCKVRPQNVRKEGFALLWGLALLRLNWSCGVPADRFASKLVISNQHGSRLQGFKALRTLYGVSLEHSQLGGGHLVITPYYSTRCEKGRTVPTVEPSTCHRDLPCSSLHHSLHT